MRRVIVQLLLVFSVMLAGVHAPAIAHEGDEPVIGLHHHAHDAAGSEDRDEGHSPLADSGADIGHHHHCPAGLASPGGEPLGDTYLSAGVPAPAGAAALASRATAPPLEPPVA